MTHRIASSSLLLVASLAISSGCGGPEETIATFTSDVVQRESCRVVGESEREVCTRDVTTTRVRVTLIEDSEERVWMNGISRQGAPGRTLLGTRDRSGGYLFFDEVVQTNANSGCVLRESLTLTLQVEEGAEADDVGVDDCIALVGREQRVVTTSAECDSLNDPPQEVRRLVRRRWQRAPDCRVQRERDAEDADADQDEDEG